MDPREQRLRFAETSPSSSYASKDVCSLPMHKLLIYELSIYIKTKPQITHLIVSFTWNCLLIQVWLIPIPTNVILNEVSVVKIFCNLFL
jgi:hypothetical protein